MIKILDILLRTAALLASLFLFFSYTTLLNSFPWGNEDAYMFWGLLIPYIIVPLFLGYGLIRFLHATITFVVKKERTYPISAPLYLLLALLLMIPDWIGFDSKTNLTGRWMGVITSAISFVLLVFDLKKGALDFKRDLRDGKI
jgi:hypothetical protein